LMEKNGQQLEKVPKFSKKKRGIGEGGWGKKRRCSHRLKSGESEVAKYRQKQSKNSHGNSHQGSSWSKTGRERAGRWLRKGGTLKNREWTGRAGMGINNGRKGESPKL